MGILKKTRRRKYEYDRKTGGRRLIHQKKRKFELGRPAAMTKLGASRVRTVRTRGGNTKHRALRLDSGNFAWGSENCTRSVRILDTVYNASNNELVRTKTLVKNTIILVDAAPFRQWYLKHYGVDLSKKKNVKGKSELEEERVASASRHVQANLKWRAAQRILNPDIEEQFQTGRLLACIASRPGQCGRADGYILEGEELAFYKKKLEKKKK